MDQAACLTHTEGFKMVAGLPPKDMSCKELQIYNGRKGNLSTLSNCSLLR